MTIKSALAAILLLSSTIAAADAPALDKRDVGPIESAALYSAQIASGVMKPGHGIKEQEIRDRVRDCSMQVDNLIQRNIAPSTKLPLDHAEATLGEAEANICQKLAKTADGWDARGSRAVAAANDAELEPFRKAGVAGDKLKLVSDLGAQLIAPGQADPTPKKVAASSVLFSLRHDGYRQWTIVRYAFKGNTQISVTEKGYADQPGPAQFR
jgi:hypothetical protein